MNHSKKPIRSLITCWTLFLIDFGVQNRIQGKLLMARGNNEKHKVWYSIILFWIQSSSRILRALGEFLDSELCPVCIGTPDLTGFIYLKSLVPCWELLVVWAIISHLVGNPNPLVLFPDSMLGAACSLVCSTLFVWNSPPDSTLGASGGSCTSPFEVCWSNPSPRPRFYIGTVGAFCRPGAVISSCWSFKIHSLFVLFSQIKST